MARPKAALRPDGHGVEPALSLAQGGDLAAHAVGSASRGGATPARSTGTCILSTPPSFARISTLAGLDAMALTREEAAVREALGRGQGGFSTKLHLRAEGNGRPITAVLTGGEPQAATNAQASWG